MEEMKKLDLLKQFFALKIEKIIDEKKDLLSNTKALQDEIKSSQRKTESVREDERKAQIKLMEKSAEFTVKMDEFSNISDEKEKIIVLTQNAEKKLKESKRTYKRHVESLIAENTELFSERNELQDIVNEMSEFLHRQGMAF
mmetsp:Transcript_28948/g.25603  ORF Transcript_28948/g.25603 Transcript_28948/m.25603 type:complete len:142 (+) Transcript_28948:242-667(+)